MRRVFDDSNLHDVAEAVWDILRSTQLSDVTVDYVDVPGCVNTETVRWHVRAEINRRFGYSVITFGANTHEYRSGGERIEKIELVFHDSNEQQICGYLCLSDDHINTVSCWIEDLEHHPLIDYPGVTLSSVDEVKV